MGRTHERYHRPTTKGAILTFAMSHEMYHRGQLTVYERLLNIEPVLTGKFRKLLRQWDLTKLARLKHAAAVHEISRAG